MVPAVVRGLRRTSPSHADLKWPPPCSRVCASARRRVMLRIDETPAWRMLRFVGLDVYLLFQPLKTFSTTLVWRLRSLMQTTSSSLGPVEIAHCIWMRASWVIIKPCSSSREKPEISRTLGDPMLGAYLPY